MTYKNEFLNLYTQYHDVFKSDDMENTLEDGMNKGYFQERKSRIKGTFLGAARPSKWHQSLN